MKKVLLIAVLAAAALSGCASMSHKGKCMGGGAVGGAVLLGPIGAIGGAAIGHEACK